MASFYLRSSLPCSAWARAPTLSVGARKLAAFFAACILVLAGCAAKIERADRLFARGKYGPALEEYRKVYKQGDKSEEVLYKVGMCYLKLGKPKRAERVFLKALRRSESERVIWALADVYIIDGEADAAIGLYRTILEKKPDDAKAINNLAMLYLQQGEADRAEELLLQALDLSSPGPNVFLNLGMLYEQHKHQEAKAHGYYSCFVRMSPSAPQAPKVQRWLSRNKDVEGDLPARCPISGSGAPVARRDPGPARPPARPRAVVAEPDERPSLPALPPSSSSRPPPRDDPEAPRAERRRLTGGSLDAGSPERRRPVVVGTAKSPREARRRYEMALKYQKQGDPFRAIPLLQSAAEMDGSKPDYLYELGWAFDIAGDEKAAVRTWKKGREVFGDDPRFEKILSDRLDL